jgi:hypothetical protein
MSCKSSTCAESKKPTSESTYNFENELNKFFIKYITTHVENYDKIKEAINYFGKKDYIKIDLGYKIDSHNEQLISDAVERLFNNAKYSITDTSVIVCPTNKKESLC